MLPSDYLSVDARRRETLFKLGASGDVLEALVAYTANPFDTGRVDLSSLPLADGPQIEAWEDYTQDARRDGVLPALARRLVQLRFPIAAGISRTDAYLAATRRGVSPDGDHPWLMLEDPDGLELVLQPTLAGRVPVITCATRHDFIAMVRALSCRNEPERVPDSMGACIVSGLNNWDRVARLRHRMEDERGAPFDEAQWRDAFRAMVPHKALYQDRVIILGREPYSGVAASAIGLAEDEWLRRSVAIRAAHECTHYFTLVAFGVMRNNLLDEVIADFAGLARVYGCYDAALALRFLGLEAHPEYRAGGRFENYLTPQLTCVAHPHIDSGRTSRPKSATAGRQQAPLARQLDCTPSLKTPPIEASAATILREIVVRAAHAVEDFTAGMDLADPPVCNRMVVALARSTLVELASNTAAAWFQETLSCR